MWLCKLSFLSLLAICLPVWADKAQDEERLPFVLWDRLKANTAETWQSPQQHDFYLSLFAWHPPFAWDKDRRDEYNEKAWGAGYGRSRTDTGGNWHGLYLMMFKDSQYKWEPVAGYAYEKIWHPLDNNDFRLGLGLTAGITMRDNWNYLPVPYVLPLGSVGYKNLSLQATFVPGLRNKGNVFFGWLRWQFD